MPCSDFGPSLLDMLQYKLDEVTKNLCSLLSYIEGNNLKFYDEVKEELEDVFIWHHKHKTEDEFRIKQAHRMEAQIVEMEQRLTELKREYERIK